MSASEQGNALSAAADYVRSGEFEGFYARVNARNVLEGRHVSGEQLPSFSPHLGRDGHQLAHELLYLATPYLTTRSADSTTDRLLQTVLPGTK